MIRGNGKVVTFDWGNDLNLLAFEATDNDIPIKTFHKLFIEIMERFSYNIDRATKKLISKSEKIIMWTEDLIIHKLSTDRQHFTHL